LKAKNRKTVTVNDKMQKRYRYALTAPVGRGFDPEFRPDLTPAQMLQLGVFCGKYMTDCAKEFPASWFTRAKLAAKHRDRSLNFFGVDASQPLSVWRKKGWIYPDDPRGWLQWYCRYYMGGAFRLRTRARSSAGKPCADTSAKWSGTASRATSPAGHGNVKRCCIGPTTAARSKAQAGSRPFAFITALAAGVARNAMSALPSAAWLAFAGTAATNGVII
jgi:hypothetical protein